MKRILILCLALLTVISVAGCGISSGTAQDTTQSPVSNSPEDPTSPTGPDTTPVGPAVYENLISVSVPITVETGAAEDGTSVFTYTYQTMHLFVPDPDVAYKVIIDFLYRTEQIRSDAEAVYSSAISEYGQSSQFSPYMYQVIYNPTRADQGVLSLFGDITVLSGGTSSGKYCISASYDLITGDVLTLGSILYHMDTKDVLCQLVIDHLKADENLVLYDEFEIYVKDRFNQDESTDEAFYFTSSGLCFYFSPYEIGPRSSGVITVELPYSELTGIISDDYFPAERGESTGTVSAVPFDQADLSSFDEFAEVIISEGEMIFLTADSDVYDVRIYCGEAVQYTVFAANRLSSTDAILLQADIPYEEEKLLLSYRSNSTTKVFSILRDKNSGAVVLSEVQSYSE